MTPMTMVFGREKSFRLGESSFPIHEDFSLGLTNRTKYWYDGLDRTVASASFGREDVGADAAWTHYFFHATSGTDAGGAYAAGDLIDTDRNGIPDVAEQARGDNDIETLVEDVNTEAGYDFQLSLTEYNAAGYAYKTIDNLGRDELDPLRRRRAARSGRSRTTTTATWTKPTRNATSRSNTSTIPPGGS